MNLIKLIICVCNNSNSQMSNQVSGRKEENNTQMCTYIHMYMCLFVCVCNYSCWMVQKVFDLMALLGNSGLGIFTTCYVWNVDFQHSIGRTEHTILRNVTKLRRRHNLALGLPNIWGSSILVSERTHPDIRRASLDLLAGITKASV